MQFSIALGLGGFVKPVSDLGFAGQLCYGMSNPSSLRIDTRAISGSPVIAV
jgi:hypothetical protein